MLKIKRVYYKVLWWRTESDNVKTYNDFDTAEEADAFIKSELTNAENIEVSKHYVMKRDIKQLDKTGEHND